MLGYMGHHLAIHGILIDKIAKSIDNLSILYFWHDSYSWMSFLMPITLWAKLSAFCHAERAGERRMVCNSPSNK